jgi:hypothetical protein
VVLDLILVHAACAACAIFSGFLRRSFAGVETSAYRPTDVDLSVGTPVFHPTDEDLSVGTPIFHPTDVNLSVGTPPPSVYLPGPQRLGTGLPTICQRSSSRDSAAGQGALVSFSEVNPKGQSGNSCAPIVGSCLQTVARVVI